MGFSIASSNRHASAIFKRPAFSALVMAVVVSGCTTGSLSTVYYDVPGTELKQAFKQVSLHGPNNGKAIGQAAISMNWMQRSSRRPKNVDFGGHGLISI